MSKDEQIAELPPEVQALLDGCRPTVDVLTDWISDAMAKNAKLEKALDLANRTYNLTMRDLSLAKQIAELGDALQCYGRHHGGCAVRQTTGDAFPVCDCGLKEAMAFVAIKEAANA
jgi:hypothetical protein